MVAIVVEVSSLAGRANGVLRPAEEHRDLGDVERSRTVLEHLWNTTVVHRWGPLVMIHINGCYGT